MNERRSDLFSLGKLQSRHFSKDFQPFLFFLHPLELSWVCADTLEFACCEFEKGHLTWLVCVQNATQTTSNTIERKEADRYLINVSRWRHRHHHILCLVYFHFTVPFILLLFRSVFLFRYMAKPFTALINHKTKMFSILNRFNASWNQWNARLCHAQ